MSVAAKSAGTAYAGDAFRLSFVVRRLRYAISVSLLLGAFLLDLHTGFELSASLFYVVPVVFTAWFIGRTPGIVAAVVGSAAWFVSQHLAGVPLPKPVILYANTGVECAIYLATAWAVARVRDDRMVERRLSESLAETKEALERELLTVGRLQQGLLPQQLPQIEGYGWCVHYATSTRAGGDYYDAFTLPDGRFGVVVADATGHGAPAAVLMAMGRALLGADPERLFPPEETLSRLDRQLSRVLPAGWFLTACYAVVDPASGRLEYSLAGHEPPLIVRARGGQVEQLPPRGGLPLGPFSSHRYDAGRARLEAGDTLVLFTDGVTERMRADQEMFGLERLRAALAGSNEATLQEVMDRLLESLDAHAAGSPATDDTTILLLRRQADAMAQHAV